MNNNLSEMQRKLLPMLSWYHEFCVQNNLEYYLLGGTMLGAARHEGFIPWDDDIDVGLPRNDYERFLKLTKNKKFNNYIVEGIDTPEKDFCYGYAKVYDTSTTLIENTKYQIKRGVYIDVFPLDGVANEKDEIEKVFKPIYWRYQLLLARTCGIRESRSWYKNLAIKVARLLPGFDEKKFMLHIDELCKRKSYEECRYVGNLYGNWGIREIVEKRIMGKPTLYHFEGLEVYGAADYDAYLTSLYGDWRKMPPKEKQVTHHDYAMCDLYHSYIDE